MPLAPDAPFPKAPGNAIKSKDWNDAVNEVIRLDNAKVNRAGADAMAGPLTIANALGVGTTSPAARFHVVDSANPAVARVQSTAAFGAARMELWSDPRGSANEWRPGYIESMDKGGFTGGLKLVTNGAGSANKTGAVEGLRVVNGNVGVGGVDPGFRMDVNGRMRVRGGTGATSAGIWFNDSTGADRAFAGLMNDSTVGFWGNNGAHWAFQMDTGTGNITASGRVWDAKYAAEASAHNQVKTTSTGWTQVPNMALTFTLPVARYVWAIFNFPGVQMTGGPNPAASAGLFRLMFDGTQQNYTRNEWHNNGWELRGVLLTRRALLAAGTHTIKAEWAVGAAGYTLTGCWYGANSEYRTLQVFEQ